jgi:hypothetical protein
MSTSKPRDDASRQRTSLSPGRLKGHEAFHFAGRPGAPTPGGATPSNPAWILSFSAAWVVTSASGDANIAAAASAVTTPSSRTSSENRTGGAGGKVGAGPVGGAGVVFPAAAAAAAVPARGATRGGGVRSPSLAAIACCARDVSVEVTPKTSIREGGVEIVTSK